MKAGATLLNVLEHMRCGALLLDEKGQVLFLNSCAEDCLSSASGKKCCSEDLREWAGRSIRKLLGDSLLRRRPHPPPSTITIRKHDRRPIVVHVVPLSETADYGIQTVLVFLDTNDVPYPSSEILAEVFQLTSAESRLA